MKKLLPFLLALAMFGLAACASAAPAPRLSVDNTETSIAYSPEGATIRLQVHASGVGTELVYDLIPAVTGITVADAVVTIEPGVADGTVFTVRVRGGAYTATKRFVYGTEPSVADASGAVKKTVKGDGQAITVILPRTFADAAIEVYDTYGTRLPAYYYTQNGARLTISSSYLERLDGDNKISVKNGAELFETTISVFDARIATPEEFVAIGADTASLSKSYLLSCDLDFYDYNLTRSMPQISSYSDAGTTALTGTVDGDGHVLRNVNLVSGSNGGLFGQIAASGAVRNLGIADSTFTSGSHGGVFAGYVKGTIENCWVRSSILSGKFACGFLGKEDSARMIRNCYLELYPSGSITAAFAEYCKTRLVNCFAYADRPLSLLADASRGGDVTTSKVLTLAELTSAATYASYPDDIFSVADGALPAFRGGTEGTQTAISIRNATTQRDGFRVAVGFDRGYAPITFLLKTAVDGVSVHPVTGLVTLTGVPVDTQFTVVATAGELAAEATFTKI